MFAFETPDDTLHQAREALIRPDLYRVVHKALRVWMADVLVALGRLDLDDACSCDHTLSRTQRLLDQLAAHAAHENAVLHPAVALVAPDAATQAARQHDAHGHRIAVLRQRLQQLASTSQPQERRVLALCLYREFAAFMGHDLLHMLDEEGASNAALWAGYSDADLKALHARILAAVDPQLLAEMRPWMVRALDPAELSELFSAWRSAMPPAAYCAALEQAEAELDARRHAALMRALMVPDLVPDFARAA